MSLKGEFSAISPVDLLQLLAQSTKSGILYLTRTEETRTLLIAQGNLVGIFSSKSKYRLGALLLRMGFIQSQTLAEFRKTQLQDDIQIGELAVRKGFLTEDELNKCLKLHVDELVIDLITWKEGSFNFEDKSIEESDYIVEPTDIQDLLLKGVYRLDELRRIREILPNDQMILYQNPIHLIPSDDFDKLEKKIWDSLKKPRPAYEVVESINEMEFNIYTSLRKMIQNNFILIDYELEQKRKELQKKLDYYMDQAELLFNKNALHEAYDFIGRALKLDSNCAKAIKLKVQTESAILTESKKIVTSEKMIPNIRQYIKNMPMDKLYLTGEEGFLFSRIDGKNDIKTLRYLTGISKDKLIMMLHKFYQIGLIVFTNLTKN